MFYPESERLQRSFPRLKAVIASIDQYVYDATKTRSICVTAGGLAGSLRVAIADTRDALVAFAEAGVLDARLTIVCPKSGGYVGRFLNLEEAPDSFSCDVCLEEHSREDAVAIVVFTRSQEEIQHFPLEGGRKPRAASGLLKNESARCSGDETSAYDSDALRRLTKKNATKSSSKVQEDERHQTAPFGLIMNGGGVKGLAFVGAIVELQERTGVTFDAYGGTSAGAIAAAMLAMGHEIKTIKHVMINIPFSNFLDASWSPKADQAPWKIPKTGAAESGLIQRGAAIVAFPLRVLGRVARTFRSVWGLVLGGVHDSSAVGRFIEYMHSWRPNNGTARVMAEVLPKYTFAELAHPLVVVASSTGPESTVIFKGPEPKLEIAVRASMTIPGFFKPIKMPPHVYYDGGLVANFAIDEFEKVRGNSRIIGLYLYDGGAKSRPSDRSLNVASLAGHVLSVFLGQDELGKVAGNRERVVLIDISPIQTVDFGLTAEDKDLLLAAGKLGALRFLYEQRDKHGLKCLPGKEPSREEFEKMATKVKALQDAARGRWAWPHRARRWGILLMLVMGLLLAAGTVYWCTRLVQALWV